MKKYLDWVKKHLFFVVFLAIAILAFPVMFVISSGMNSGVRKTVEDDTRSLSQKLNALKVNYSVEPVMPGMPGYSASRPPNAATTDALKGLIGQSIEQVDLARGLVTAFNRNDFQPIIEGLFPKPAEADSVAKRDAMSRRWVSWNADFLRDAGAGRPPAPEEVARRVEEKRLREVDRLLGVNPDAAAITPELEAEIRAALVQERVNAYSGPAQQSILFYASPTSLASVAPFTGTSVPELELCWEWQWVSWVNQMLIDAVRTANENDLAVAQAPVKRLELIQVEPLAYPGGSTSIAGDLTQEIPVRFDGSLSGRAYSPDSPNALYDIRYATMRMIVSSKRIPEILDAFASSNLITVIDLDIAAVDDLQALADAGYHFGGEHVVRMQIRVETIWLREWTREFMPPIVRARLGVKPPEGQENESPDGGDAQNEGRNPGRGRPQRGPRND
jgi:hypothetical protein